ncbi:MAG: hypothetical protein IT285_01235, partial [Bdellovibrionales bacterium]|nr:hypothetical protein [Bdellovibrionales bacterium]
MKRFLLPVFISLAAPAWGVESYVHQDLRRLAEEAFQAGDYAAAQARLHEIFENRPVPEDEFRKALELRGLVFRKSRGLEGAARTYEHLV